MRNSPLQFPFVLSPSDCFLEFIHAKLIDSFLHQILVFKHVSFQVNEQVSRARDRRGIKRLKARVKYLFRFLIQVYVYQISIPGGKYNSLIMKELHEKKNATWLIAPAAKSFIDGERL